MFKYGHDYPFPVRAPGDNRRHGLLQGRDQFFTRSVQVGKPYTRIRQTKEIDGLFEICFIPKDVQFY